MWPNTTPAWIIVYTGIEAGHGMGRAGTSRPSRVIYPRNVFMNRWMRSAAISSFSSDVAKQQRR